MPVPSELVDRYLRYRKISKKLNHVLVERLSKDDLHEGGRDLGILKKDILVFDSEDEMSILMDYCIYHVLRHGQNAVQRFLAESPFANGSEECLLLERQARSWYSVFRVAGAERGAGIRVLDLLRRKEHLLMDVGLSNSASPGHLLASQVVPTDDFIMTGGAALPLQGELADPEVLLGQIAGVVFDNELTSFEAITPKQEKDLAKTVISMALSSEASSHVRYEDPKQLAGVPKGTASLTVSLPVGSRAGRNEPCPCGSGKKFKKCCGQG